MIEKPTRPKQPSIQERQPPRSLDELINRYDLANTKIYDFLDGLVDLLNSREETVDTSISNINGDISGINSDISDLNTKYNSIIESGSNANGSYIKFKDGTLICYGKFTRTPTWGAWGVLYSCDYTLNLSYPHSFIAAPTVTLNTCGGWAGIIARVMNTSTDKLDGFTVARPNNPSAALDFEYIAIGKWK